MDMNWSLVKAIVDSRLDKIGGSAEYRRLRDAGAKVPSIKSIERMRTGGVNVEKRGARNIERALDLPEQSLRMAAQRKYDDLLELDDLPPAVRVLVREAQREGHPSGPARNSEVV